MDVTDKVAIVTGAMGGIGFTSVQYLLRNGAKYVAIFDLPEATASPAIDCLKKLADEFHREKFAYYKCNVANKKEFIDCYEKVCREKTYVDILVNNAGVLDENDPDRMCDVNIKAVINGTMLAMDRMATSDREGVVVNIGSIYGIYPLPPCPVYGASKHAVVTFVRSLMKYGAKPGVRVVCICPDVTTTSLASFENFRKSITSRFSDEFLAGLLKHTQKPESVAAAIVDIIRRGKNGDVWIIQKDEPPFNVGYDEDLSKLRIPF